MFKIDHDKQALRMLSSTARCAGLKCKDGVVSYKGQSGPVVGSHAEVTGDSTDTRFTATRFLLLGPLALAAKKKTGEVWLIVQGENLDIAVKVDAKQKKYAMQFAALFNQAARKG